MSDRIWGALSGDARRRGGDVSRIPEAKHHCDGDQSPTGEEGRPEVFAEERCAEQATDDRLGEEEEAGYGRTEAIDAAVPEVEGAGG